MATRCLWRHAGIFLVFATIAAPQWADAEDRADTNCDGSVNLFDIEPFTVAVSGAAAYAMQYPDCNRCTADVNADGSVNLMDIDAFVTCMLAGTTCGPCFCEIPTPPPPPPTGVGPHAVGRLADISLPNSVVAAGTFPAIPGTVLEQDGSQISGAFLPTGKDAIAGFDVRGQVRYPAAAPGGLNAPVAGGGPFPLVIIAHGNHNRFSPASGDPSDENYRGYTYLQDLLATNGFISVSIDLDDFTTLFPGILSRAWLVLCQAENMRTINGTGGHRLESQINLDQLALIGHSRGGDAVVQAFRMNVDGAGPFAADRFHIRAVWGIASTRFFDGTFNWDRVPPIRPAVPPGNITGGPRRVPFLGMWGAADGDVSGGDIELPASLGGGRLKRAHVEATYDGSDSDPKQFVWVEGANHNFWNTSWFGFGFGDDGITTMAPAQRISPAQQQDLARGYGLAFLRAYIRGEAAYETFLKGPANEVPPTAIATSRAHLQYQVKSADRSVVDDFETNNALGTTSRGQAGVLTATLIGPPDEPELIGGNEATATESWFHNTRGVLFEWNAMTDLYRTQVLATETDVTGFDYLSFRAALDVRGPGASPQLRLTVTLLDGADREASVCSCLVTNIPVAQTRSDDGSLTKSMLKTVRIPLCEFKDVENALNLSNITRVRFEFDRAAGKMAIDDIEFTK